MKTIVLSRIKRLGIYAKVLYFFLQLPPIAADKAIEKQLHKRELAQARA